jgi:hypothetical protein
MIRITSKDFFKFVDLLKKEGMDGAELSFSEGNGSALQITTVDKTGKQMVVELSDTKYPFMPRVTKTDTF